MPGVSRHREVRPKLNSVNEFEGIDVLFEYGTPRLDSDEIVASVFDLTELSTEMSGGEPQFYESFRDVKVWLFSQGRRKC